MVYQSFPDLNSQIKTRNFRRYIVAAVFVFIFAFTLTFLRTSNPEDTSATLAGFSAGNIINDYTMSNYTTMSEADIQAWLSSKNSCNNRNYALYQQKSAQYNWKGYYWHWANGHFVCLSEERFGNAANQIGSGESAAHIIWQAAQDYHINPQVLLVLLQKETGLITDDIPNTWDYNRATGYGCPDTAPCDTQYYGFKNQVRNAAKLFHNVLIGEWSGGNYPAYQTVFIKYHPNYPDGSWVYIQNRATSSLYRYTPYQPNAASLAAGYGTGNYLSSYGNRNFYNYFTDWFGSTQRSPWKSMSSPRVMTVGRSTLRINISDYSLTDKWVYTGENYTFDRKLEIPRDGKMVTCLSSAAEQDSCILLERLQEFQPDLSEANKGMAIAKQYTCQVLLSRDLANCSVEMGQDDYITYVTSATINKKLYYISDTSKMIGYLAERFTPTSTIKTTSFKSPRYMKTVAIGEALPLSGNSSCPTYAIGTVQYYANKFNLDHKTYYAPSAPAGDLGHCAVPANTVATLITPIADTSYLEKFAPFKSPRNLKTTVDTQSYNLDNKLSVCKNIPKDTTLYFTSKINIGALSFYRSSDDSGNACIIPSSVLAETN